MTQEQKEQFLGELSKLHARYELSRTVGPDYFEPGMMDQYTNFAFGSPAMGDEQLETEDFQPMWDSIADKLSGKNVVLFGSYNWNSGEFMDLWAQDAVRLGANLVADGLAILDAPQPGSDEERDAIALGVAIARA